VTAQKTSASQASLVYTPTTTTVLGTLVLSIDLWLKWKLNAPMVDIATLTTAAATTTASADTEVCKGVGRHVFSVKAYIGTDDDEVERRPQRRRYEEPVASRLRRELVVIAENVRALR
jgi:hypothetical protein